MDYIEDHCTLENITKNSRKFKVGDLLNTKSEALFNIIIHQSSKHHKRRNKTALGTLALLVDVPK